MVKIEKLSAGAKAVFTRNGVEQPVVIHQLMTIEEFRTLKVLSGELMYSIDENEVGTVQAPVPAPAPAPKTTTVAKKETK